VNRLGVSLAAGLLVALAGYRLCERGQAGARRDGQAGG
jgi:hypothetical protein